MKTFSASENDGTIIISNSIDMPRQGTYISIKDGKYTVSKGIVRPCLIDHSDGYTEEEAYCKEAAFGKETLSQGTFFSLNETGDQKCRLALQTLYFGFRNPEELIRQDTKRFSDRTALDFTSKENKRKIDAGVSPSLLLDQIAVWDMFRRIEVQGTRSTVFASELVPMNVDPSTLNMTVEERLLHTMLDARQHNISYFKLLLGTAKKLCARLGIPLQELTGKVFVVHRDPALPDASTCFLSICAGVMSWDKRGINHEGIVFNPLDKFWKAAGGDFDGDTAVLLQPSANLLPLDSLPRVSYKQESKDYASHDIIEKILQDVEDRTTQLLGPVVLAATRLIERGAADNEVRSMAAGLAQATVEAKKHVVDSDAVQQQANHLFLLVSQASEGGAKPFITDFINALRRAIGLDKKIEVWNQLLAAVNAGVWDKGTKIEQALCERVLVLDQLFKDIDYFRQQKRPQLPLPIVTAARALCSSEAKYEMQELTRRYAAEIQNLPSEEDSEYMEDDELEALKAETRDRINAINTMFQLACMTGQIGSLRTSQLDAQQALVGFGPARIAARLVPAEVFEALGTRTKRILINLKGHDWASGPYDVDKVHPIPSSVGDYEKFSSGLKSVTLNVVHKAKNSTRVMLES